ncbi:MAG: transporter substrate-binding domain-containing protein [Idiomarina sp.]|nr:transporter substrate-binding domain-containing protein [Idiomarina sp.]
MKSISLLLALILSVCAVSSDASAVPGPSSQDPNKTLRIAFGQDKPPYVITNRDTGVEIDIARAILEPLGYRIEPIYLPYRQLHNALTLFPDIDAIAGVGVLRDSLGFYVPEFAYFNNVAISRAADENLIREISDLTGHRLVAWQGASYPDTPLGPEFHQLFYTELARGQPGYSETVSQAQQNAMFWANRVDIIIIDELIFQWYRQELRETHETSLEVSIHALWPERHYTEIAFRSAELAHLFKEGLKRLKDSGEYDKVYEKYRIPSLIEE